MSIRLLISAGAACLATASMAQIWTESGDAGDQLATAQSITSAFNQVNGTITPTTDPVDMYKFVINDPANFGVNAIGTSFDTMIFLFNASGNGVAANDDWYGLQSAMGATVGAASAGPGAIPGLTSGTYYLAVGRFSTTPKDAAAASVFSSTSGNGTVNGAAGALNQWTYSASAAGAYTLNFQGVAPVPEPATVTALGLGALALVRRRRNRK